jgi:four helix bundle protein
MSFKNNMTNNIVQRLIEKTYKELEVKKETVSGSRVWRSTNGYIYLVSWSDASLLRVLATKWFDYQKSSKVHQHPKSSPEGSYRSLREVRGFGYINRLEAQLLDCLRSVIANIEEGFARPTTQEYLNFLGYSQASLKEGKGDFQRLLQDGFIRTVHGSSLQDLGIVMVNWHDALKKSVISVPIKSSKTLRYPLKESNSYRNLEEFKFKYKPVDNLNPESLTYEMFIELVNKTDWNLRKLVESLETKQNREHKFYQVEKARLGNIS